MSKKYETFNYELSKIKNNEIREFVTEVLKVAPAYFWEEPASSTGKYHHEECASIGGLVKHTKFATRFAIIIFNKDYEYGAHNFFTTEQDIIIAALLLHDLCKKGIVEEANTRYDHPLLVRELIEKHHPHIKENLASIHYDNIMKAIEAHMGNFNTDKEGNVINKKPQNALQQFVHMCDVLGSRPYITVDLKNKPY